MTHIKFLVIFSFFFAIECYGGVRPYYCENYACQVKYSDPYEISEKQIQGFMGFIKSTWPNVNVFKTWPTKCQGTMNDVVVCSAGVSYTNELGHTVQYDWGPQPFEVRCPDVNGKKVLPIGLFPENSCPEEIFIEINGPSQTKSLPLGPVLDLTATVTMGGSVVSNKPVSIDIIAGVSSTSNISGSTDASGQFHFKYVPLYLSATKVLLEGRCSGCSNVAQKTIDVMAGEGVDAIL